MRNREIYIAVAVLLLLVALAIFITRSAMEQPRPIQEQDSDVTAIKPRSTAEPEHHNADQFKAQVVCFKASKKRVREQGYQVQSIVLDKRSSRYKPENNSWLLFTDMETIASDGSYVTRGSRCVVLGNNNELIDFSTFDT